LARFLAFALPLLLLFLGLAGFAAEHLAPTADTSGLARLGLLRHAPIAGAAVLGGWLVEALGLTALFLLIQGRSGRWWLDGLLTGWIAWIFRGPLLLLSLAALTSLPREPWWSLSLRWWLVYPLGGLLLAILARGLGVERVESAP
jgi:hypothetical protein